MRRCRSSSNSPLARCRRLPRAKASRSANGGKLNDFDKALLAAYTDMAQDVTMIRMNREERRKRMMQKRG